MDTEGVIESVCINLMGCPYKGGHVIKIKNNLLLQ